MLHDLLIYKVVEVRHIGFVVKLMASLILQYLAFRRRLAYLTLGIVSQ